MSGELRVQPLSAKTLRHRASRGERQPDRVSAPSDTVIVTVVDTEAPIISAVTATPSVIPQTNHQMVPVSVRASITDCDSTVSCRIVSVTSNEPEDGFGDGDTAPDWEITGPLTLKIRAERAGRGTGRTYTIRVACTDASGNTSTSTVTVTVPHE